MHEVLNSLKQHPTQIFLQKLINFEKPPKFFKHQNLGKKRMKCIINEWERIIPNEEHLIQAKDQVRNVGGLRSFGVREERNYQ